MAGIQDWDRPALKALAAVLADEEAQATASEIAARVAIDQFDRQMARAWVKDAISRGLARRTSKRLGAETYELTDKGIARLQDT